MKIGLLLTGHAPEALAKRTGDYDTVFSKMLAGHGFEFEAYAVVDNVFPDSAHAADGWLITGSKHGAYEDHRWIPPLEDLIRKIHAAGLPMIGVCFGHQIIAQALGGRVEKFAKGWAVGRTEYEVEGKRLMLNAWHQDQVTQLPEGARVLGRNAFCENAVLAYADQIWTIQPHPEFDTEFVEGLITQRGRGVVPDDLLDAALARNDLPDNNADIAAHMAAFFRKERA